MIYKHKINLYKDKRLIYIDITVYALDKTILHKDIISLYKHPQIRYGDTTPPYVDKTLIRRYMDVKNRYTWSTFLYMQIKHHYII